MAVKALAIVSNVQCDSVNAGKFYMQGHYTGIESGNLVNQTFFNIGNVDPTVAAVTLEQAVKQFVKDELTNNNGYSFGLLDSVRLLGALL